MIYTQEEIAHFAKIKLDRESGNSGYPFRNAQEERRYSIWFEGQKVFDFFKSERRQQLTAESRRIAPGFDAASLRPRPWLYFPHLARGIVSVTIALGGVAKTSLCLVEAVAMASGRNLLGTPVEKPLRVIYFNGEELPEELDRRLAGIYRHYGITKADVSDRLIIDERRICIASVKDHASASRSSEVEGLIDDVLHNDIDVLNFDPVRSFHRVDENSNDAMDVVLRSFAEVAQIGNCAVHLVHWARKTNGAKTTVEDARGAGTLINRARAARVANTMSVAEAAKAGIEENERHRYFHVEDGKPNMTAPGQKSWYRFASVPLFEGTSDTIGVVTQWSWPDAFAEITVDDLRRAQAAVATGGPWRADQRSPAWVGCQIAKTLGLDISKDDDRAKVCTMLKRWIKNEMFEVYEGIDSERKPRKFVRVGKLADQA
jgi:hypothetical protein